MQFVARNLGKKAIKLEPNATAGEARNLMLRYNISRIVVAKGSKPVGVVTEKSLNAFLYKDTINRSLDEIRLDQIVDKSPITVTEDTDIRTCASKMLDNGISSLLVVDDTNNLKGIFTKSDLVDLYSRHYEGEHVVREFMSEKVHSVLPNHSIHTVIATMVTNKISRIVVVRGQKPVGIVTGRDLLPISILIEAEIRGMPSEVLLSRRQSVTPLLSGISHVMLARDVMKRDPITIGSDSDLAEAALIMTNNRISGIPVVDTNGDLIGIVTKTDIVRALASF